MRSARPLALLLIFVFALAAQTGTSVGSGPFGQGVALAYQFAFTRGNFSSLVLLPPAGDVKRFGPTGLVQEFDSALASNAKLALVRASSEPTATGVQAEVFQILAPMYAFYSSTSAATAGYPNSDTQTCPATLGPCQYQVFDKGYILFAYGTAGAATGTYLAKDQIALKWMSGGGLGGYGSATANQADITARSGVTATRQPFTQGEIFTLTSGSNSGKTFGVRQPIFATYSGANGHLGFLGLPTSDEITLPGGLRRQTFEGGAIEYSSGSDPVFRLPVSTVSISTASNAARMNLGDTVRATATLQSADGSVLTGREISWVTSNRRVVSIEPSGGETVTLRAVGGGTAVISAVSEGRTSQTITIFVVAPCCQIGEGAPTAAVERAFSDAVTRLRLNVRLPAASPVRRVGAGYVQELADAAQSAVVYLVAKPDRLPNAVVVTGSMLARYAELGGPAGVLGYPISDPAAGGARQLFENGALGGSGLFIVTNPILARWAVSNYEAGPAGAPAAAAEPGLSFTAAAGIQQAFTRGTYFSASSGAQAGRVYLVSGPILERYRAAGGVDGVLGFPLADEVGIAGLRRQEFEGGSIELNVATGQTAVNERRRQPQISASPPVVGAGGRIRIAAGGFDTGATLRISVSGQPDFVVQTASGAYAWEALIPANAPGGLVTLRAVHVGGAALAVGSYVVQSSAETLMKVSKVRGDNQEGRPAARLPEAVTIEVRDEFGNLAPGVPVFFEASPGASIEAPSAVTDELGRAQAWVRLPAAETITLATARAGRQVVTFSARSAAGGLANFPRYSQADIPGALGPGPDTVADKGALLVSAAAMVRYFQNLGQFAQPNGAADPIQLNGFLREFCVFDFEGREICDGFVTPPGSAEANVNLWRLANFTGGNLDLASAPATLAGMRDSIARGDPILIALELESGGKVAGTHFLVASGVSGNGSVLVMDPNPRFARTALEEYLAGFSTPDGRQWKARISAALRLAPRARAPLGFVVFSGAGAVLSSPAGQCGVVFSWASATATGAEPPASAPGQARFHYCEGTSSAYQIDIAAGSTAIVTDLGNPGARQWLSSPAAAAFRLARPATHWTASPLEIEFAAAGVVNAASFRPQIAPGSLVSIFGTGLAAASGTTSVTVDGRQVAVSLATPFQVNVALPADLAPGERLLRIESSYGSAEQPIRLEEHAPAIFFLGGGRPAMINSDGKINSPDTPARRGTALVLYGTGFGSLQPRGSLWETVTPVTADLQGHPVTVLFSGQAPGFPGLYQVNLMIPDSTPPGLRQVLRLRQGGADAGPLTVAVQ
jgi:uncharacterized protein (TIGR03437 family)